KESKPDAPAEEAYAGTCCRREQRSQDVAVRIEFSVDIEVYFRFRGCRSGFKPRQATQTRFCFLLCQAERNPPRWACRPAVQIHRTIAHANVLQLETPS